MIAGQGGAQGAHDVLDARLVAGDDIGVALGDDGLPSINDRALRQVQSIQRLGFVEDRALGAVEVFWRILGIEDATPEGDGIPGLVGDGENESVAKRVVLSVA